MFAWIRRENELYSPFDGSDEYKYECPGCHEVSAKATAFCPECGLRLTNVGPGVTINVQANIYDVREVHHNCTVEVLRNSRTGECSVGWYEEGEYDNED